MKFVNTAIGTALGLALASASPVLAQAPAPAAAAPAQAAPRPLKLSPQAQKAIIDLQTAVKAKNVAAIPGLVAAAQALAKVPDDRYAIASLQLQAAIDADDNTALVAAADAMRANGAPGPDLIRIYLHAGQKFGIAQQYGMATNALDKAISLDPNNTDALLLKSDLLLKQKLNGPSVEALTQAIARQKATGVTVPESWYQAAVARSYEAKLPATYELSRQWASAYPTPTHWRDAINIYRNMSGAERPALIDLFRLARVTKALGGESDYLPFAEALIARGYPGEAVAVLQEGAAANSISLQSVTLARTFALAKGKSIGDRASAATAAKTALAGATGKPAMLVGDRLLGYGDYAQAAALYRVAIGKADADQDLVNLRLGEALAQSGDKAGAIAALKAVGPGQAEIAKYWLAWVSSRA
jgi:tetratricopeptide (TPR) repeat protein